MIGEQTPPGNGHDPRQVRQALDAVFAHEITVLSDIDSRTALKTYNLTTLVFTAIAVEREKEIIESSDPPVVRYNRQTFMSALLEMGIPGGAQFDDDLTAMVDMGFLSVSREGELQAEAPAHAMVGFLDTLFPKMQGMNLIAFVMQMNDEVVSGRKSLGLAKQSLAQTLRSRGVALTREKPGSWQLKESAAKRIANLRSRRSSSGPTIYSSMGHGSERSKVKDVFDKGTPDEASRAEQERQRAEERSRELAELHTRLREAEERSRQLEIREQSLGKARDTAREVEQKARDAARELEQNARKRVADEAAAMAEKKAELEALADRIAAAEQQIRLEREAMEKAALDRQRSEIQAAPPPPVPESELDEEEALASRIAAFEAELAMPCPICLEGKIVTQTTARNKTYYTCSNNACRFVSWEKPCHFECPLCKNPFLTEFTTLQGKKGLKCPRAGCGYVQDNLLDPRQNRAAEARPIKRKKKLVRRIKRRL